MSVRRVVFVASCIFVLFALGATVVAQQEKPPSRVDIFGGYSWLDSRGDLNGQQLPAIVSGFDTNMTYFFSPWGGATVDFSEHFGDTTKVINLQVGPTFRFNNSSGVVPFIHALVGLQRYDIDGLGNNDGIGITAGGGLDLTTKWRRLNLRLVQADYQYGNHSFDVFDRVQNNGIRLSTGLVFNFGGFGPPPQPPSAACSVQPTEVFAGEPVTLTAAPSNFNPKRTLTYTWAGTGVKTTGTGATVQVDTKDMKPGSYPARATISDGKKGTAECTANVVIKQPQPPTVTCAANPNVVQVGNTSSITATGTSPDNRPLTYTYQASAGNVSGSGTTATLNTEGAAPGTVNVTCTVADDRNLTASDTASVTVQAPPPPPPPPAPPEASQINSINFKRMVARVDNAAKAALDDVALRLQRDADARLVVVGKQHPTEKSRTLAGQRAINAKAYLVKEKGIDASRVDVRSAPGDVIAEFWIVPAGATFKEEGLTPVTEPAPKAPKAPKKQ